MWVRKVALHHGQPSRRQGAQALAVSTRRSRLWQVLAWVAIVAAFAALRAPFLSVPLERDEGEYAYIAQRALHGEVPYRDAFDQKPPGIFVIYTAIFLTLGQSTQSIHAGMALWTLASMILLYRLVSRRGGPEAGLVAALALSVMTIDPSFLGNAANTEIFMILPVIGGLLCLVPREGRPHTWRIVFAGALGATACWIKPPAVTDVTFMALWLLYLHLSEQPRRPWKRLAADAGLLVLGGLIVTVPVLLYFLAVGAWKPFVYCVFTYNAIYTTLDAPRLRLWPQLFWTHTVRPMVAPLWPFMILAVVGFFHLLRRARRDAVLFGGWLVFSFAGVCAGGHFREHYFIQTLPAAASLVGLATAHIARRRAGRADQKVRHAIAAGICVILVLSPVIAHRAEFFASNPLLIAHDLYGANPFDSSPAIAREIREHTTPADKVLVIGSEPQILFYANRRSATRYILFYPLAAPPHRGLQRELDATLREIAAADPKYIVDVGRINTSFLFSPRTNRQFFNHLAEMIDKGGYRPIHFYEATDPTVAGQTFTVVEGQKILDEERQFHTYNLGVMLYRRPGTG